MSTNLEFVEFFTRSALIALKVDAFDASADRQMPLSVDKSEAEYLQRLLRRLKFRELTAGARQAKLFTRTLVRNGLFQENNCGQEARRQHLITSVWLFHATLFDFDRKGHGESGLAEASF